jgi:hypothetical protein
VRRATEDGDVVLETDPEGPEYRPLTELHLDPQNPRLPPDIRGLPEADIAVFIERQYDPLNVARSIAKHGYFSSEPLIAIHEGDVDIVVEGNRRLVALKGLTEPDLRARFAKQREWDRLATESAAGARVPALIPVVFADSRIAVAPIIGYRHITGILAWDPFSQARYVAQLVDDHDMTLQQTADLLGEDVTVIRSRYRNYKVVEQARTAFDLDVTNAETDFGVLTRALQSRGIREYVGAPEPAATQPGTDPIPTDRADNLARVFVWLFGGPDGAGRVVGESRDVVPLGNVLASETGTEVLVETGDLSAAVEAVGGIRARLLSRLNSAIRSLRNAQGDIEAYRADEQIRAALDELERAVDELRGPVDA